MLQTVLTPPTFRLDAPAGECRGEQRFSRELSAAAAVQRRMVQRRTGRLGTLAYAAAYSPAAGVGGDYYDFPDLGPGSVAIVLGDVAGKGLPAAITMSSLQGWIRCECERGIDDLTAVLKRVNEHLLRSTLPEHYATLFFGAYDDATRRLTYVNCAQQPAIIRRASGMVERMDTTALPVGLFAGWTGETRSVELHPGDAVCLASDGVVEAGIQMGVEFGERGVTEALTSAAGGDIQAAAARIVHAARLHVDGQPADDMTVIAARVL